jgi:hypothetical protein
MESHEHSGDPAFEPVYEAGGGEAEGFEESEDMLIENAEHGEHGPELDEGLDEDEEAELSGAEYGEADEEATPDA